MTKYHIEQMGGCMHIVETKTDKFIGRLKPSFVLDVYNPPEGMTEAQATADVMREINGVNGKEL